MIINHNMNAMNSHRQMVGNTANAGKSMEKLSSGLRINRAGDDAAGLAISEKMRGQIRGLDQGSRNAQDSISLLQTAEGSLNETHSILQRMRELAVQSSNDTNTDADRKAVQDEVNQLTSEIDRIGNTTEFNTKKLLDGSVEGVKAEVKGTYAINNNSSITNLTLTASAKVNLGDKGLVNGAITITRVSEATNASAAYEFRDSLGKTISATDIIMGAGTMRVASGVAASGKTVTITGTFTKMKAGESVTLELTKHEIAKSNTSKAITAQIGANAGQTMQIGVSDMRAEALGIKTAAGTSINVSDKYSANAAISTINTAIAKVSTQRSSLGAIQNRLDHTINNLGTASENLQSSESRIRDVDMAKEMMSFSKNNILSQAAQAMLAQANQQPQGVLQLLR